MQAKGIKAILAGFILAIVITAVPFTRFILNYLAILVHELGHTIVYWLYGYPAIPAFDFSYGGGVSFHHGRNMLLLTFVIVVLLVMIYLFRGRRRVMVAISALTVLYLITAFSSIHEAIILSMGHGAELVFVFIFLYRAVTGRGVKIELERPLYAMCGWFILFQDIGFAYRLINDETYRSYYENEAKGGGHWMDFSQIAEIHLGVDLSTVASIFGLICFSIPVLLFLVLKYEKRIVSLAHKFIQDCPERF